MKTKISRFLAAAVLLSSAGTLPCAAQIAQYHPYTLDVRQTDSRAQRSEFYLLGQYWHSENITEANVTLPTAPGPNPPFATSDLTMKLHDSGLWGFGMGYNLNDHFNLNGEFTFGYIDYDMTWNGGTLSGTAFEQSGKFNLDFNLLKGPLTPFVSAGLGYWYMDSGIPSGPPNYYSWWDYWWGYTVVGVTPTYTITYFTLNAAAGLRWDVNDRFFLKAVATSNWMDVGNGAGWAQTIQGTFILGWKF